MSAFRLDTYEVTVGRFRPFLAAFQGGWRPAVGDGRNPNDAQDSGWRSTGYSLPLDGAALLAQLRTSSANRTWTDDPAANETLPINFVTWPVAFAFCIWDGGRLPTEAEWIFAAQGGGATFTEVRNFPWSNPPTSMTIDATYATYGCPGSCTVAFMTPVGSKPKGYGLWGHADLSGNVREWTRDTRSMGGFLDFPVPCIDCAQEVQTTTTRGTHGGSLRDTATNLSLTTYYAPQPYSWSTFVDHIGIRCARSP